MWLWLCFWTGLEWVDQQLRHENNNNIVPQQSSLWKVTRVYVVLFSSGHSIYSCVCNQEFGSEKRRGGGQAFEKPAIATDSRDGQKTVIWFLFVDHQSFPHTALVDFFLCSRLFREPSNHHKQQQRVCESTYRSVHVCSYVAMVAINVL